MNFWTIKKEYDDFKAKVYAHLCELAEELTELRELKKWVDSYEIHTMEFDGKIYSVIVPKS